MQKALWATVVGTGIVLASSSPVLAQMRTSQPQRASGAVTAYSTPKPSGAVGLFGWYPFLSSGGTTSSAIAPGIAANLWFTPNLSFGVWGFTAPFATGAVTSADLEGKVKFFQSGTGAWSWALTGTGGVKYLSYSPGTGVGVALGLLLDWYLSQGFTLQGRLGYTPWLNIAGTNTQVLDGKLGIGYSLTDMFGLDVGLRSQSTLSGTSPYSMIGPYVGVGFVF